MNAKLLGWSIAGLIVAGVLFLVLAPSAAVDQVSGPAPSTVPSSFSR